MKKIIFIAFLIISLSGCGISKKDLPVADNGLKSCQKNSDCKVIFNVRLNENCNAGCFNNSAVIDKICSDTMKWEPFPPGYACTCKNNRCTGEGF